MLAKAPESILNTEFVKRLVESINDDQKSNVIKYGFVPYMVHFIATVRYLSGSMKNGEFQESNDKDLKIDETAVFGLSILGTLYFLVL